MVQNSDSSRVRRAPAHRKSVSLRLGSVTVSGIVTTTVLVGLGAFLGLTSTGSTYAYLTGSGATSTSVVSAGSMDVKVGSAGTESSSYTIPSAAWTGLLPGDAVRQQVSVKVNNTPSRVSSALSIKTTSAVPTGFELRVHKGVCPTGVLTGAPLSTTDHGLGTWTATETSPVCVQISLRSDAPNSLQASTTDSIGMIVTAKQQ